MIGTLTSGKFWLALALWLTPVLTAAAAGIRTIHVSQQSGFDADNDGADLERPLKTLARAKVVALTYWRNSDGFEILLRAGERYDNAIPMTNALLKAYDPLRHTFALVWDIDRPLLLSTYGGQDKAWLYGGRYTHEGGPTAAIAVTAPSSRSVTIQNLHFKHWQVCAFFAYETQNISFINNIVEEIGTLYFPLEETPGIYGAGAVYPKNSSHVLIKGNYLRNIHNHFDRLDEMHVFYFTRLSEAEVCENTVIDASGPPLKFRRAQTQQIWVHDNAFFYTGPSHALNQEQEGWVRYSGDAEEGCPSGLIIQHNKFYYPFCWSDQESCSGATATRCSVSNPAVCGNQACDQVDRIQWIDNDFRYTWESIEVPPVPTLAPENKPYQPVVLHLQLNHPNPFTSVTQFQYQLLHAGMVRMAIYDLLGREVTVLFEGWQTPGAHRLFWDVRVHRRDRLADGIYFCRMMTDGRTETIKILKTGEGK